MKTLRIVILAVATTLFINQVKAQGCMGGGSDLIGVSGFIQPQYNFNLNGKDASGNSLNTNNFTFNRARLGVMGSIPYDIDYYIVAEFSSFKTAEKNVHLLDAYVSYTRFSKWAKIAMGQFKSPFSMEQNTACSGLYTINRSEVVNQLAGPQRDLGFMITGGNDTTFIQYSLAVLNGSGMNAEDDNTNKNIVGRLLVHPLSGLTLGGSFNIGKINPTNPSQPLNEITRFGGELQYKTGNLFLQGEYIRGVDKLHSLTNVPVYGGCGGIIGYDSKPKGSYTKDGFVVMASYMTPWNLEPVVKFDT